MQRSHCGAQKPMHVAIAVVTVVLLWFALKRHPQPEIEGWARSLSKPFGEFRRQRERDLLFPILGRIRLHKTFVSIGHYNYHRSVPWHWHVFNPINHVFTFAELEGRRGKARFLNWVRANLDRAAEAADCAYVQFIKSETYQHIMVTWYKSYYKDVMYKGQNEQNFIMFSKRAYLPEGEKGRWEKGRLV
jgi:hypothetical protein